MSVNDNVRHCAKRCDGDVDVGGMRADSMDACVGVDRWHAESSQQPCRQPRCTVASGNYVAGNVRNHRHHHDIQETVCNMITTQRGKGNDPPAPTISHQRPSMAVPDRRAVRGSSTRDTTRWEHSSWSGWHSVRIESPWAPASYACTKYVRVRVGIRGYG